MVIIEKWRDYEAMKVIRKISLASVIFIMLVCILTACQANTEKKDVASETKEVNADGEAHLYKDATGKEVEIPNSPKRIVAIQYVGDILALGVKLEGTTSYWWDTYPNELADVQNIGDRPVNVEKILALQPDLIITDDLDDQTELEQLSKIAPTVSLTFWLDEPFAHLNLIADVLGEQDEAKAWMERYDESVQKTKEQLKPYIKEDETVLLLIASGKELGVSGVRNGGYTLYKQLGFNAPSKLQALIDKEANFGFETISMESIADFAADRIFIELDDNSEVTKETAKQLQKSEVWKNLPAFKNNQVYTVSNIWGLGDASSMKGQLEEIVQQIVK